MYHKVAWYENKGNLNFTTHIITTSADGAFSVSAADIDGDGDHDLFVSGAAGQTGAVFLRKADGTFQPSAVAQPALEADQAAEDMAALWLDADADGDFDLLVTSGGVECVCALTCYGLRVVCTPVTLTAPVTCVLSGCVGSCGHSI